MEAIQRHNMVRNQVRVVGIEDDRILNAMLEIERHKFASEKFQCVGYSDGELPISDGRLIARPEMIAKLLEAAHINSNDNVIEVGCGTGYSSHIISMIAKSVTGVDNCKTIISSAKKLIGGRENLSFIYQDFKKIFIGNEISLIIVNGAVFDKRSDFSVIEDRSDLFDFHSAILIDTMISQMGSNCRLITVEGYYKYHPMNIVRYRKDSREVLDQVYFPQLNL